MNRLKLAIFDMDGLLLDTERWSCKVFCEIAYELGYIPNLEEFKKEMGRKVHNNPKNQLIGSEKDDPKEVEKAFFERFVQKQEQLLSQGAPVRPGVLEILHVLKQNQVQCVIASSSSRKKVTTLIEKAGLSDWFDEFVCSEDIVSGKPAPDVFLQACANQHVETSEAVVFEDSENGALAALGAGIFLVLVPDVAYISEDVLQKSDVVVSNIFDAYGELKKQFQNLH
jgi:HAD superfamily hydrolase (TIGR01509 family)